MSIQVLETLPVQGMEVTAVHPMGTGARAEKSSADQGLGQGCVAFSPTPETALAGRVPTSGTLAAAVQSDLPDGALQPAFPDSRTTKPGVNRTNRAGDTGHF